MSGFLNWLSLAVWYKPNRLKKILPENLTNRRNSAKSPPPCHQWIYNFWLEKSITSTDSTNSLKRIPKKTFLQNYKDIVDANLREEVVQLKNGTKFRYTAIKMIYVESIRKLHNEFSSKHVPVSLTTFLNFKLFYCVVPSEKEKQCCACMNWWINKRKRIHIPQVWACWRTLHKEKWNTRSIPKSYSSWSQRTS